MATGLAFDWASLMASAVVMSPAFAAFLTVTMTALRAFAVSSRLMTWRAIFGAFAAAALASARVTLSAGRTSTGFVLAM